MAKIVDPNQVEKVIKALNKNGVVVFPTETVYGLAVKLDSYAGYLKLIDIKKRPSEKSFPIMVSSIEMANKYAKINPLTKKLLEEFSPGPLTVVVKAKNLIPKFFLNDKDTVAIRIPDSELIIDIISRLESPIIVTSANFSGEETPDNIDDIVKIFNRLVDIIVVGNCSMNQPSTIVDVSDNEIKILRKGAIKEETIRKII